MHTFHHHIVGSSPAAIACRVLVAGVMLLGTGAAWAQEPSPPPADPPKPLLQRLADSLSGRNPQADSAAPQAAEEGRLVIGQRIPLKSFIDLVSRRLNITVIYDERVDDKEVSVVVSEKLSPEQMLDLLKTVVEHQGLTLVRDPHNGWYRIIAQQDLAKDTLPLAPNEQLLASMENRVVSTVFHIKNMPAASAVEMVQGLLTPTGKIVPLAGGRAVMVTDFGRNVRRVQTMLQSIDVGEIETLRYPLRHTTAARAAGLIGQLVGEGQATVVPDDAGAAIWVTTRAEVHNRVRHFLSQVDQPNAETLDVSGHAETRVYRIRHNMANRVYQTLRSMMVASGQATDAKVGTSQSTGGSTKIESLQEPGTRLGVDVAANPASPIQDRGKSRPPLTDSIAGVWPSGADKKAPGSPVMITLDESTNSVIVMAPAVEQDQIGQMIQQLDRRRPQVMIETIFVTVTNSDDWDWRMEIEATLVGSKLQNPTQQDYRFAPGSVAGTIMLGPSQVSAVITALDSKRKGRVYAAPRMLVNDNAVAVLNSVEEQPFTSVNAGQTVSTTTFAGFAEAGTQLSVQPHITESNHILLRYEIVHNTFTGPPAAPGVPPPRKTDLLVSEVRVPDGHAVLIGGLNSSSDVEQIDKTPILGDIPLIGMAFQGQKKSKTKGRVYAFIRPIIVRDDSFEDLRYLSEQSLDAAGLPANAPSNEPLLMEHKPLGALP